MDDEFNALEEKIGRFVQIVQRLRADNIQLRQQLGAAHDENKQLNGKIAAARARLEALLQKIPESDE